MPAAKSKPKAAPKAGKKGAPKWVWIVVAAVVVIAGVLWLRARKAAADTPTYGYAPYPSGSAYGTGGYLSPDDISTATGTTTGTTTADSQSTTTATVTDPSPTSTQTVSADVTYAPGPDAPYQSQIGYGSNVPIVPGYVPGPTAPGQDPSQTVTAPAPAPTITSQQPWIGDPTHPPSH